MCKVAYLVLRSEPLHFNLHPLPLKRGHPRLDLVHVVETVHCVYWLCVVGGMSLSRWDNARFEEQSLRHKVVRDDVIYHL